ncbi:MAG: 30S ribosomal protein S8 [Candidatus Aenigmatarchaeota archaeon]|nr:MAG: 30S ribosomal protein S8 [Candidatus Aenigmarchaeota archaeon]
MRHDLLADTFCIIKNTEEIGRHVCVTPASSLIEGVLKVMQRHKYIGNYELIEDGKGGKFKVHLLGRINDCGVSKPRFSIGKRDVTKWEKKFLPADNIGILILTTSKGVMDQREAVKKNTGGKLLGYVY